MVSIDSTDITHMASITLEPLEEIDSVLQEEDSIVSEAEHITVHHTMQQT